MSGIVGNLDKVKLVGTAANGEIALAKIDLLKPDLVILDISFPETDGIEILRQIKNKHPNADVIVVSSVDSENASLTMKALELGALDFVPKPKNKSPEESIADLTSYFKRLLPVVRTRWYARQTRSITNLMETAVQQKTAPKMSFHSQKRPSEKPIRHIAPIGKTRRFDVLAIGVSTGGPNALATITPMIPPDFPVPILVVQHMPPMFTYTLAVRLDFSSAIKVVEAEEGRILEKSVMYIAPGGRHMIVKKGSMNNKIINLIDTPPVNSCRPSADVLFQSVAQVYGKRSITLIMTGMGSDGTDGVAVVRECGGISVVQDQKSSLIWGMPGAVVAANQADFVVPLEEIVPTILKVLYE